MKTMGRKTMLSVAVLVLVVLGLSFFLTEYWLYILNLVGVYALVALGLNVLSGYCGQISVGHAAFFALGAFASAFFTGKLGISFWLALPLSGVVAGIIAFLVGIPVLRLKFIFLAIATIGLNIMTTNILFNWPYISGGYDGISVLRPSLGTYVFRTDASRFYIMVPTVLILTLLFRNIIRTRTGRAFLAIRESETAAVTMGINVTRYKVLALVISAFYAGIAGSLYAHLTGYLTIQVFDFFMSITFLAMIIVGGIGSILGSFMGALFIVLLPELLRDVPGSKELQILVFGLAMIAAVIFKPKGLASIVADGAGAAQKLFNRTVTRVNGNPLKVVK